MKRREFLSKSLLSLSAASIASGCEEENQISKKEYFDPYEQNIPLGKSGLKVSRITLGTGMRGYQQESNHTRMGQEKFTELVQYAYNRGIRVFDTADLYGSMPYLANAMKGIPRGKYKVVSKFWFRQGNGLAKTGYQDIETAFERYLKELQTDYIDLVLLHCVTSKNWNKELAREMDVLSAYKEKGRIKAHGISTHSLDGLKTAASEPWVDSVHTRINPYGVSMDSKNPDDVVPVLRQIHAAGKGIVGMKIIGEGRFRDDEEKKRRTVDFVLNLGCVDTLLVGCETPAEINNLAGHIAAIKCPTVS